MSQFLFQGLTPETLKYYTGLIKFDKITGVECWHPTLVNVSEPRNVSVSHVIFDKYLAWNISSYIWNL